ncbi:MAG: tetratricopeptide repeat protein [Patescibacteria group bacterium]
MKKPSPSLIITLIVVASAVGLVAYRMMPKQIDDRAILEQVKERVKDKQIEQKEEYLKQAEERVEKLSDEEEDNDANALIYTAVYYNNLGEKELALDYYLRALEKDPTSRLGLHNLASLYEDLTRWDKAEERYLELIAYHPTYIPAYRSIGYLYRYRFPDPDQKIEDIFKAGLSVTNNHPDLLNWIIAYYQETDRPEIALSFSEELARQLNAQKGSAPKADDLQFETNVPGLEVEVVK